MLAAGVEACGAALSWKLPCTNIILFIPCTGVLLSGGLDSSLVAAVASRKLGREGGVWGKLHSFCIGLPGSPDLKVGRWAMALDVCMTGHYTAQQLQVGFASQSQTKPPITHSFASCHVICRPPAWWLTTWAPTTTSSTSLCRCAAHCAHAAQNSDEAGDRSNSPGRRHCQGAAAGTTGIPKPVLVLATRRRALTPLAT